MSDREPCPYRIVDDVGSAFALGAVGGTVYHLVRGTRNAPYGHKFRAAFQAVQARAPILGGNFAVWGGLFSAFDCTFTAIRRKEDPYNSIMSGFFTGGVLAIRAGPKVAGKQAAIGGILLAMIEGLGVLLNKKFAPDYNQEFTQPGEDDLAPPIEAPRDLDMGLAQVETHAEIHEERGDILEDTFFDPYSSDNSGVFDSVSDTQAKEDPGRTGGGGLRSVLGGLRGWG